VTSIVTATAEVGAVVVGAAAIFIALRGVRNQLWLQTFSEYTRRYAEIVRDLPTEARSPTGNWELSSTDAETSETVLRAARSYLNLCSEEFYLHSRGRIDKETWAIWRLGMEETFRLPWMRTSWRSLRDEYSYFGPFCEFVENCIEACPQKGEATATPLAPGDQTRPPSE